MVNNWLEAESVHSDEIVQKDLSELCNSRISTVNTIIVLENNVTAWQNTSLEKYKMEKNLQYL